MNLNIFVNMHSSAGGLLSGGAVQRTHQCTRVVTSLDLEHSGRGKLHGRIVDNMNRYQIAAAIVAGAGSSTVNQLATQAGIDLVHQPAAPFINQMGADELRGMVTKLFQERRKILNLPCKPDMSGKAGKQASKTPQAKQAAEKLKAKVRRHNCSSASSTSCISSKITL